MKNNKKKFAFAVFAASVFALVACTRGGNSTPSSSSLVPAGGSTSQPTPSSYSDQPSVSSYSEQPSSSSSSSSKPSSSKPTSTAPAALPEFNVVFKNADNSVLSSTKIKLREPITKPADPTAPAGKVFYGWKNVNNGGQIWDFDNSHKLNQVMSNVELVPVFVPASQTAQTFEAELVPEIQDANDGTGLVGATYSGGAFGKQFVFFDYDNNYGDTCVSEYSYRELAYSQEDLDDGFAEYEDEVYKPIPSGMVGRTQTVRNITYGAMVHFNYQKGNTLTWELESDAAAENVVLFARFSAEYGLPINFGSYDDTIDSFDEETYQVIVNGTDLKYGSVAINNIQGTSGATLIYCQDYLMSASLSLKKGTNIIQMVVNNEVSLNGTIASSAPCVDSIKLFSDSTITWPKARYTNLIID